MSQAEEWRMDQWHTMLECLLACCCLLCARSIDRMGRRV